MTKHTPDFRYLRGLKPVVFSVDECIKMAEYRDKILTPEGKLSEPIIILKDALNAKDARIAELEAELAAERSEHQHTTMCFDKAWEKIEWLRSALKRQFLRAQGERAKVEMLRIALEQAARDYVSANGVRPEWWNAVIDLYADKRAATMPKETQCGK